MKVNWQVDSSSFNALNFSLRLPDRVAIFKSHPHVILMTYTWLLLVQVLARYIHINTFECGVGKFTKRKFSSRFPYLLTNENDAF